MHKEAMHFLYPHLLEWKTEPCLKVPQHTKNAVLLLTFPNGCLTIVFNVTSVHTYALTLLFVLYQWQRLKLLQHLRQPNLWIWQVCLTWNLLWRFLHWTVQVAVLVHKYVLVKKAKKHWLWNQLILKCLSKKYITMVKPLMKNLKYLRSLKLLP